MDFLKHIKVLLNVLYTKKLHVIQETHVIIQIWQCISKDSGPRNNVNMSINDRKSQIDCCQWFNIVVILCK